MKPFIVGLGGTLRPDSISERALAVALDACGQMGARTEMLCGRMLDLPNYDPGHEGRSLAARRIIKLIRDSDGLIFATPAYHGGPSGLIKNVLDYVEDTVNDCRPYLDSRAVGIIVASHGNQAMGTTLSAMRSIVHSLRGWPTPLAVTLNGADKPFDDEGLASADLRAQLEILAVQVVEFAQWQVGRRTASRDEQRNLAAQP